MSILVFLQQRSLKVLPILLNLEVSDDEPSFTEAVVISEEVKTKLRYQDCLVFVPL